MITKISLITDEEEEKEELFKITKIKPLTTTIKTQFGIGAKTEMGVTLTEEPSVGVSQRMRGIGEPPEKYPFEGITIELKEAQKRLSGLWWSEIKTTEDKWKFFKHENWSPELQEADLEVMKLSEQASKMGVNIKDWINYGVYSAFFATMAAGILPILSGLPKNILNNLAYKVEGKTVKGKELLKTLQRVTYPDPRAGFGAPSKFDRKIFDEFVKQGGLRGIGKNLKTGVTITEITPRFAFRTKLYAGLPADEIVKSLVEAGKVSADMVKGLDPVKVSQVTQQLLNINPALANEFLKAIEKPEVIPTITETILPKIEQVIDEETRPKAFKAPEPIFIRNNILKAVHYEINKEILKVIPKEPSGLLPKKSKEILSKVDNIIRENFPTKASVKELDISIIKAEIIPKIRKVIEEVIPKVEPKEPTKEKLYAEKYDIPLDKVKITKIPKVEEPETAEALRILQKAKIEPEEIPKVEVKPLTAKEKFMAKIEEMGKVKGEEEVSKLLLAEERYPERFAREEIKEFKKFITEEEEEFLKAEAKYPAMIVKEEIEELKPLATPTQIKKAHAIANSKALISEKGKMKPQYREIAKIFTEQESIKKMTKEEAETFIDMLDRLPEPKMKAGKLVAPSIPRTMKLTTLDFFKKKYGEPTPIWLLTDQTYYATKLGIKPLVEPFEKGKMGFDLEFRKSSNLVDRMVNKLNKIAKTPGLEKIKSKIKNIPTKAESKMAELINKHETTPPGLSPKEEDVFKYFRNLSKDIWRRENEVREKVDLPPIKYKTAYFRHTADAMAKEMLEGKYPFPQGIKYWSEKMVGKKIFNPMEFHRKLSDDLIDIWSKDIRAVTKAMLWNGLKEIYLAQPSKFLNEQLNAISKDLPEYRNLSSRDQVTYDQTRVMPASTKKWLVNYINQVIKGQETELDASLNRIVTKSGLKGIFDKALSPFGRSIGRKPITNVFVLSGRVIISGVMGWVPRQIIRNAFQQVQNLALYGVRATTKALLPASIDKNLKGLLSESLFLKSYTGFEELPTNLMGKLEKVWLGPYGIVAVNNAKQGMKASYWDILELIKNPKFKKYGWADPERTKDTPKGFLYPSEKEKLLREMEFGASATQYQYIPIGMPGVFRYKALVPLTRLQSWWMNYFTKFLREATHRAFKGRPSWSGEDGPTLPWSRRINFLKYLIIGGAILTSLGYRRSFLLGVLPVYMSPAMQVALGVYNYATATEDWQKKRALKQIYYSWKAFIPGSLAWRDFLAVWKGEKDLEEILFYGKKEEKKPEVTTIGKPSIKKITIPKISKIKINKIKPIKNF